MDTLSNGIIYYDKNIIRVLTNWTILNNATVSGNNIIIQSGGIAGIDLTNEYCNGLKASKYRQLVFKIDANITNQNNYENYIEFIVRCVYKDNDGQKLNEFISVNATQLDSTNTGSGYKYTRVIGMENYDLESCTVYVANHSTIPITLIQCENKRSQDINGSQVGESIGFSISLLNVVGYLDGCEIYYDGIEKPDKLWWMGDENDELCGVNVNNDRMIGFSRKNEILMD